MRYDVHIHLYNASIFEAHALCTCNRRYLMNDKDDQISGMILKQIVANMFLLDVSYSLYYTNLKFLGDHLASYITNQLINPLPKKIK